MKLKHASKEMQTVACQTKLSGGEFDKYVKEVDIELKDKVIKAASAAVSDTENKEDFEKRDFIFRLNG